jgi:anti-sigma B factor antagonist
VAGETRHQDDPADRPWSAVGGLHIAVEVLDNAASVVVLRVSGEIDMLTAPELAGHLETRLGGQTQPDGIVVLDLTGVTFLGSAGLAVLATARNSAVARNLDLRLIATTHEVLRPLELTGLHQVLTIVPDLAAATNREP